MSIFIDKDEMLTFAPNDFSYEMNIFSDNYEKSHIHKYFIDPTGRLTFQYAYHNSKSLDDVNTRGKFLNILAHIHDEKY